MKPNYMKKLHIVENNAHKCPVISKTFQNETEF